MISDPQRTCALVVAIGECALGPASNLPGALVGARRFEAWLAKRLAPGRIRFLGKGATTLGVSTALTDLKDFKDQCDCLIVFWASHGRSTEHEKRYLLLEDGLDLAVDDVIEYLRADLPNFTRQIVLFDACALPEARRNITLASIKTGQELPYLHEDRHFVFACATGAESAYPASGEPSVFASKVLELIEEDALGIDEIVRCLESAVPGSHQLSFRDGRSPGWSVRRELQEAWTLEKEAKRIAKPILDASQTLPWRHEALRIAPTLDLAEDADFTTVIEKITRLAKHELASQLAVALLLRAARRAQIDVRDAIKASPLLSAYEAGTELIDNLKAFEKPCYIIKTDYRKENDLGVRAAWFYSGEKDAIPRRVFEAKEPVSLDDGFNAVCDDMEASGVAAETLINIVAPMVELLAPAKEVLTLEVDFPVVFRWRDRAEGLGRFRRLRPKLRDLMCFVKGRVSQGAFTAKWFDATESGLWGSVDLPVLRSGAESDADAFLSSLVPFAAIARPSFKQLAAADEDFFCQTLKAAGRFAAIPIQLGPGRKNKASVLAHMTLVWDDRELPEGYMQ